MKYSRTIRVCALLSAALGALAAQQSGSPQAACLTGRISGGGFDPAQLTVQLGDKHERGFVGADGSFEFCGIEIGQHRLQLTTMFGDVIWEGIVAVPSAAPVSIVLRGTPPGGNRPGVVSPRELRHKPPRKAVREFQRAFALRATDPAQSLQHLLRAVEIDPEFLEAQNNLGSTYIKLGRYKDALGCLTKASQQDPTNATILANLATALMAANRNGDAEEAARRALRLGADFPFVHYVLGVTLAVQKKSFDEALRNLRAAAEALPAAHLFAARVLLETDKHEEARAELRAYLDSGAPPMREHAQRWLASLERSRPPRLQPSSPGN